MTIEQEKSIELRTEAEKIAKELINTAKETARQMLLSTNLDISKIPLICDRIGVIKVDIAEIRMLMEKKETDHESRLRKLEQNMWRNAGVASILGALGMWALQYLIK